jgi:hypothetical protein
LLARNNYPKEVINAVFAELGASESAGAISNANNYISYNANNIYVKTSFGSKNKKSVTKIILFAIILMGIVILLISGLVQFIILRQPLSNPDSIQKKLGIFDYYVLSYILVTLRTYALPNYERYENTILVPFPEDVRTKLNLTQNEKIELAKIVDSAFRKQCNDPNVFMTKCSPYAIYAYKELKYYLDSSIENEEYVILQNALDTWRDYFRKVEFNTQGGILNDDPYMLNFYSQKNVTLIHFHFYMHLLSIQERKEFNGKLDNINPTDRIKRYHLLMSYELISNASVFSEMPSAVIERSSFLKEVCGVDIYMAPVNQSESDYLSQAQKFCKNI